VSERKLFNHRLVDRVSLPRVDVNGKRHYVLPDGTKLRSVTTVLSEKSDKTHLIKWREKVGEAEATRITTMAARRGTALHTLAENYVLNNDDYLGGSSPFTIDAFQGIKKYLDNHVDNIYGIELPLFSKALQAAGTADLIAEFDGVPTIIDFKTSRKTKKEEWIQNYFIQATTYSLMFQAMYKIDVQQIAIFITVEDEAPQLFLRNRGTYVSQTLEMFKV